MGGFSADESFAVDMDRRDILAEYRDEFFIPSMTHVGGNRPGECVYLAGHSLGLQPRGVRRAIEQTLEDWAQLGVEAHVRGRDPWIPYHEQFRRPLAMLVGAREHEVVAMNALTVNLHLMLATFYRPTRWRWRIVIDEPAFPSDAYAIESHVRWHGFDPARAVVRVGPRPGERILCADDVVAATAAGDVALVWLNAVNYLTGQWLDMGDITKRVRASGAVVGWDLAHAIGNVPLRLHEWGVDCAVWCSYKYLNGGPGAVGGAFVHERHAQASDLPRLVGWWGSEPATRFRMPREFRPCAGADGWQVSNPPILAMAPLKASLALFERAGMELLRRKSEMLTAYAEFMVRETCGERVEIITPADPLRRGSQLSLVVRGGAGPLLQALRREGIVCDVREPDVVRVAPVPLYNTFHDVWRFARALAGALS